MDWAGPISSPASATPVAFQASGLLRTESSLRLRDTQDDSPVPVGLESVATCGFSS